MLSAVDPSSRYESLENHILRKRGPPTSSVSGFDVSARQRVEPPNSQIPGLRNPIPTSSARPGKMTNQHIPYTRIMHVFPNTGNILINQMVEQTQVVFVHRKVHQGLGTNKMGKICTINMLNQVLADHSVDNRGRTTMTADNTASEFSKQFLTWEERWSACTEVQNWVPDGVCLTAEHQHERPYSNIGNDNSNNSEAFNIVVQGPVLCEKASMKMGLLDVVYVCLFATMNPAKNGNLAFWSFQWELHSRTDLRIMRKKNPSKLDSIVSKFKIGKVLDVLATRDLANVNVCIEEELSTKTKNWLNTGDFVNPNDI